MSIAQQTIRPGRLEAAYREELHHLHEGGVVEKIWAKQPGVWKSEPEHAKVIRNRLGWLEVVTPMRTDVERLRSFARDARKEGFGDVVLLGMGGSSLAPEVFSLIFPRPDGPRFHVLDSTDPGSILAVRNALDLRRTLFVVASKSGKTIETLSQFHYFRHRLQAQGVSPPGANFVAITDAGSYLDQLASEYSFRQTYRNPADIGGRYSALSYFGLLPAALCGVPVAAVLASALEVSEACKTFSAESNPALALGALVGTAARSGADKLFLLATPTLVPLGNWVEQLVAESTGKERKGVIPVAGEVPGPLEAFGEDGVFAVLTLVGEERGPLDEFAAAAGRRGMPVVEIVLSEREQLGGEFFKWEFATAVAGAVLQVNPFDEPNVQEAKDLTARVLEGFQSSGKMPTGSPLDAHDGVELFASESLAGRLAAPRAADSLRAFLNRRKRGDYLALLAYLDRNAANEAALQQLRVFLRDRLKMPVLLGFGPRYLHSIGQLYKGGPASGMFIELTAKNAQDVAVPGASYTFGQLELAQALGDLQALEKHGKPAIRLHFTRGTDAGLAALEGLFADALPSTVH